MVPVIWVNEKYLGICGLHTCEGRVAQFVRNHGITAPKKQGSYFIQFFLCWGLFTAPNKSKQKRRKTEGGISVADPHWFQKRISVQHFLVNADPDPGFWYKNFLTLHSGPPWMTSSDRRSLEHAKEKIQHFKTWICLYFYGSFLPSWIRIPNADPDPDPVDQNKCSGSRTPGGMRILTCKL